jgi:hypothetical protein
MDTRTWLHAVEKGRPAHSQPPYRLSYPGSAQHHTMKIIRKEPPSMGPMARGDTGFTLQSLPPQRKVLCSALYYEVGCAKCDVSCYTPVQSLDL